MWFSQDMGRLVSALERAREDGVNRTVSKYPLSRLGLATTNLAEGKIGSTPLEEVWLSKVGLRGTVANQIKQLQMVSHGFKIIP